MISRKIVIGVSAALLVAVVIAAVALPMMQVSQVKPTATATRTAATTAATKVPAKLKVGILWNTGHMWAPIAKELGYFSEEALDVDVVEFAGGAPGMAALLQGSIEIMSVAPTDPVIASVKGNPVKVIYSEEVSWEWQILVRPDVAKEKGINPNDPVGKRMSAVKGLSFATYPAGGTNDMFAHLVFPKYGLEPTKGDVKFVNIAGLNAMRASYEAGKTDGIISGTIGVVDYTRAGSSTGGVLVFDGVKDWPELFKNIDFELFMGTKGWIDRNDDVAYRFIRAIVRANEFIINPANLDKIVEITTKWKLASSTRADIEFLSRQFNPTGRMSTERFTNTIALLTAINALKAQELVGFNPADVYTNKYVDMARKDLGLPN